MTTQTSLSLEQIHALLAKRQYAVQELSDSMLSIQEVESGISLRAVLEGEILFLSLVCMVVPETADNGGHHAKNVEAEKRNLHLLFSALRSRRGSGRHHAQQFLQTAGPGPGRRRRHSVLRQLSVGRCRACEEI